MKRWLPSARRICAMPPPMMPTIMGSTTVSANRVAIAASMALPPAAALIRLPRFALASIKPERIEREWLLRRRSVTPRYGVSGEPSFRRIIHAHDRVGHPEGWQRQEHACDRSRAGGTAGRTSRPPDGHRPAGDAVELAMPPRLHRASGRDHPRRGRYRATPAGAGPRRRDADDHRHRQ